MVSRLRRVVDAARPLQADEEKITQPTILSDEPSDVVRVVNDTVEFFVPVGYLFRPKDVGAPRLAGA